MSEEQAHEPPKEGLEGFLHGEGGARAGAEYNAIKYNKKLQKDISKLQHLRNVKDSLKNVLNQKK